MFYLDCFQCATCSPKEKTPRLRATAILEDRAWISVFGNALRDTLCSASTLQRLDFRTGTGRILTVAADILFHHLGERVIAYAPLRGIAFELNRPAFEFVARLVEGTVSAASTNLSDGERNIVDRLFALRLLTEGQRDAPGLPPSIVGFTSLVLLLTRDCNLRCRYCFSEGGHSTNAMTRDIALSAIDLIVENCSTSGKKKCIVSFHGGGEPTLAWEVLKDSYYYARQRCDEAGIRCRVHITSNGTWTDDQADWITTHVNTITVSCDGTPDITDRHRPLADGGSSWPSVSHSIEGLRSSGCNMTIRATVSDYSVGRLGELIGYFHSLGAKRIQLEPMTCVGRAIYGGLGRPDPETFCREFRAAVKRGKELGCDVFCSYFRPQRRITTFCGADGRVLNVTPEGVLTTCHRVTQDNDPGATTLTVGGFDYRAGRFSLDQARLTQLHMDAHVRHPQCVPCVAKYHCAGGCFAQNAIGGSAFTPDPYRCRITKQLLGTFLSEAVKKPAKAAGGE
jgi:uncharacterized protein